MYRLSEPSPVKEDTEVAVTPVGTVFALCGVVYLLMLSKGSSGWRNLETTEDSLNTLTL